MTQSYRNILILFVLLIFTFVSCKKDSDNSEDTANSQATIQEPEKDFFSTVEHMGVCYGPYHHDGQAPGTAIPKSQIETDLALIAKNFDFFRTYTVADGMDQVVEVAKSKSLEVALGVWCYPGNEASTKADIDVAVTLAKQYPNTVSCIVIGNETNVPGNNYVAPATVATYMDYTKTKLGSTAIPISACITGAGAANKNASSRDDYCGPILQKCKNLNAVHHQVILLNIYPYFAPGSNPADITANMQWSYNNGMSNAEKNFGLTVVIGEIGWPSGTKDNGTHTSRENPTNEGINFNATLKWVDGNNYLNQAYNSFWFEMFDEPWKVGEPNGVGPSWGIYEKNGATTPKFTIPPLQ